MANPPYAGRVTYFTPDTLRRNGFERFVTFDQLGTAQVPDSAGVYVVIRQGSGRPDFLSESGAGSHKGVSPTVDVEILKRAWVDDASVVYIGKATRLKERLNTYRRQGLGLKGGHWGGRYIWQCADVGEYLVAWKPTAKPAAEVESAMLAEFKRVHGRLPFANRRL